MAQLEDKLRVPSCTRIFSSVCKNQDRIEREILAFNYALCALVEGRFNLRLIRFLIG